MNRYIFTWRFAICTTSSVWYTVQYKMRMCSRSRMCFSSILCSPDGEQPVFTGHYHNRMPKCYTLIETNVKTMVFISCAIYSAIAHRTVTLCILRHIESFTESLVNAFVVVPYQPRTYSSYICKDFSTILRCFVIYITHIKERGKQKRDVPF